MTGKDQFGPPASHRSEQLAPYPSTVLWTEQVPQNGKNTTLPRSRPQRSTRDPRSAVRQINPERQMDEECRHSANPTCQRVTCADTSQATVKTGLTLPISRRMSARFMAREASASRLRLGTWNFPVSACVYRNTITTRCRMDETGGKGRISALPSCPYLQRGATNLARHWRYRHQRFVQYNCRKLNS